MRMCEVTTRIVANELRHVMVSISMLSFNDFLCRVAAAATARAMPCARRARCAYDGIVAALTRVRARLAGKQSECMPVAPTRKTSLTCTHTSIATVARSVRFVSLPTNGMNEQERERWKESCSARAGDGKREKQSLGFSTRRPDRKLSVCLVFGMDFIRKFICKSM